MKYFSLVVTYEDQNGKEQTIETQMAQSFEQLLPALDQIRGSLKQASAHYAVKEYELKEVGIHEIFEAIDESV